MESQDKLCQSCHKSFIIDSADFGFYEKIKVPPPTLCPDCRQRRRYAWRNEQVLYRRNCGLCGKSTVTIYHPESPFIVYCSPCWWGDSWDAKSFSQDIDFTQPFFDQFHELQLKVPRIALLTKNSVNSEYTNHAENNKNCYLCFDVFNSENVLYSSNCWNGLRDSSDCNMSVDKGALLYECISCDRDYNCQFCLLTHDSINCMYCFDCRNCSDCFLSYNLRNKKYCILNEQYSKEEYEKRIKEYNLASYAVRADLYQQWINLIQKNAVHRFAQIEKSVDVSGDVINNSKNCHQVFDTFSSENVKYSVIAGAKDTMDVFSVGFGISENLYEDHAVSNSANTFFTHLSYDDSHLSYCDSCHNSNDLFGCVGLKKSKYCILNKPYEKEEYEVLKAKLIDHMKLTKEYGEFFPAGLSPFGYNETHGQIFMPLTKEQAVSLGFNWQDDIPMTKGKGTVSPEDIADEIANVSEDITKAVLTCISCDRNYNIVPQELDFYRHYTIPVPHLCANCRYARRIALRPARKLWHRTCMCSNIGHTHENACSNEFETSYSPDRTEKVFCEECYQKELL